MPQIERIRLDLEWDVENTRLVTGKLYRHVNREEADLTIRSQPDPFHTEIVIGEDITPSLVFTRNLLEYIHKRITNDDEEEENFEHVHVTLTNDMEFTYHGNNNPEKLLHIIEELEDTHELGLV